MFQRCGGFGDTSSIASRPSIFNFVSRGIPTENIDEIRFSMCNALGHYSVLIGSLVLKLQYVSIKCWANVLRSIRGIWVKVKVPYFQGQSWWYFMNENCLLKVSKGNRTRMPHILLILWVSVATMYIPIWKLDSVVFFHKPWDVMCLGHFFDFTYGHLTVMWWVCDGRAIQKVYGRWTLGVISLI